MHLQRHWLNLFWNNGVVLIDIVFKKADKIIHNSRSRLYTANHKIFGIKFRIINIVACVLNKLHKENTLCTWLYPQFCVNHKCALSEIYKLRVHFSTFRYYS